MKNKLLIALSLLIGLMSTGFASPKEDVEKTVESFYKQYYKEYLLKPTKGDSEQAFMRWVASNAYLSDAFKKALRKTVMDAHKENPEMGLDFDPIVNGQDRPDKGYRAKETQIVGGKAYVVMEGIGEPDYTVPVELVRINNKWMINGIGSINRSKK